MSLVLLIDHCKLNARMLLAYIREVQIALRHLQCKEQKTENGRSRINTSMLKPS